MINRFSTDSLKRQGAKKSVQYTEGRFINTFQNSSGTEKATQSASITLSDNTLVSGSIYVEDYHVALAFFCNNGTSVVSAETMALIAIDSAKLKNVTIAEFLNDFQSEKVNLDSYAHVYMNLLRPVTSQTSILLTNDNSSCYRKRDLLL